jgi:epoxide hydrolase
MDLVPFKVQVSDEDLADLKRRLRQTRWPDQLPETGWAYGTDTAYLRELCTYWADEFDWRAVERAINGWPQFLTAIDGQQIHFLHVKSTAPSAVPLLLLHGWPGSVLEFQEVIGPLVDPEAYGGSVADAFDIVCPSLPGYGWSGPTREPGWDLTRIARTFAELMDGLGYTRFAVQGGDWGSMIAVRLAQLHPDRIVGVHLNLILTAGPQPEDGDPTPEEAALVAERSRYGATEEGYVAIQSTKPQTLATALNDSPAGLASWMVDRFHAWTDCDGDLETALSRDSILAAISVYWLTRTAGSAARLYFERRTSGIPVVLDSRLDVPVGCAVFPHEIRRSSRRWAERHYNVQSWTEMPRGGHFAAWEQPDPLVADIRRFFGKVAR